MEKVNNSPGPGRKRSWTDDDLRQAVQDSYYLTDVCRRLGLSANAVRNVLRHVKRLDLDCSHFKIWKPPPKNGKEWQPIPLEVILVKDSTYSGSGSQIKKKLLKYGLKEDRCEICGQDSTWRGKKLVLELHHKNGDNKDHRIENIQIICPNCHTQSDNHKGRNRGKNILSFS